ncbi:MAG TPA: murein biosynthesis integral membrane protein MurJ [Phycisphaerales bacterium]|nr:murein biosynthesis integral membrane protein MurJ [Phycisphaerales bacterium]
MTDPQDATTLRPNAQADDHAGHKGLSSAVRVISSLTLVSRIAGLARDIVTARIVGDSALGSAFMAAWAIPNLFRRLFGEGALAAAFLPEYTRATRDDGETADRFATLTVLMLALVTGGLLLVGEAVLLAFLVLAPPDPDRALSLRLMMLMLPYMPLVCVAAILGGMLQAHGRFGPTAAAPVLLNVFVITAGVPHFFVRDADPVRTAYFIGIAAVLAGAAQVAWSLWALRGRVAWRRGFARAAAPARRMMRKFLPVVVGMGTIQLNSLIDTLIAMWPVWLGPTVLGMAYPLDPASNSVLAYTQRLYQFPLGVFGIAVATAVFPMLARTSDDPHAFLATLRRGLRLSFFIGLPASLGLLLVREPLTGVMYGGPGSAFSDEGVRRSAAVLLGYAPGVWAYSLNHVVTRAFYAGGDTTTPMRVAIGVVGLNLLLNVTLIWPLGEAGLAWSTSISATVQLLVLIHLSKRLTHAPAFDGETLAACGRVLAASLVMAGLVWGVLLLIGSPESWSGRLATVAVAVAIGGLAYPIAAAALRCPELRWLVK